MRRRDFVKQAGIAAASLDGYTFEMKAAAESYEALAIPIERNEHYAYVGWAFYTDQSGVIRGTAYGRDNGYRIPGKGDSPVRHQ